MVNIKRTSGFSTLKPRTPYPVPESVQKGAGVPYVALGFVARTGCGQLLRLNAISGRTTPITYKRRRQVPAHA